MDSEPVSRESQVSTHLKDGGEHFGPSSDRRFLLLFAILIVVALITRRRDAVLNPQFFAEDGAVFYADAYTHGWHALLLPVVGYFESLPRLIAMLALAFPFRWAPLVMNLVAIAIQATPPFFLLTPRFSFVGSRRVRCLMAFLLVAIPTSPELHANITCSQWHVALLALMVLVAQPPNSMVWRAFDCTVLVLCGASGPFCILLLPVAALMFWRRRSRFAGVLLAINGAAVALQAPTILMTRATARSQALLGATPMLLIRLVGGHVILGPLLGPKFVVKHPQLANPVCIIAVAGAALVLAYVARKGPLELRLILYFGAAVMAAGLFSPQVSTSRPQWPLLEDPFIGARYWFLVALAWLWTLLWLTDRERPNFMRLLGSTAIVAALATGLFNWRHPKFADLHFAMYAEKFQQLPPGKVIVIPINPPGFAMGLRKH